MKKFIHKSILSKAIFWGIINIVMIPRVFALQGETSLTNPLNAKSIPELIKAIAGIVAKVGIPIAAIFIIYAGLLFVTARGNEEKLKSAKKTFLWAMIGTAILLGAVVITDAIVNTIQSF